MLGGVLQYVTGHGVNTAGNLGKYNSCPQAMIASSRGCWSSCRAATPGSFGEIAHAQTGHHDA